MHNHIRQIVQENIDRTGIHIQAVMDGPGTFFYTIGMRLKGLPDLLFVGNFTPNFVSFMLNELCIRMSVTGKQLDTGLVDVGWNLPIMVSEASDLAQSNFTVQAGEYYGDDLYRVLQIIICDPKGRFPGEHGVADEYNVIIV